MPSNSSVSSTRIRKNLLYPSANGNAEVISDKVEFYLNSARADLPTIDENNPFRMDFNGELSREVEAELGVLVSEEAWKIQGVAISGASKPETKAEITRRRMHFNVIMISKIDESFTDIEEKQKNSLESEETESMTGIKMHFYKTNIFDKSHVVYNTINFIYNVACILCCIILPQRINQNNQMIENIESIFLLLVSLITVYNTLIHIYKKIKLRIKVSVMHCKNNNFEKKFNKKLYEKHVFKKYKLHPVTLVAINLCAELLYKNSKK